MNLLLLLFHHLNLNVHELTHAGKANIVHRRDIRSSLIKLLCNFREPTDRPEILVAETRLQVLSADGNPPPPPPRAAGAASPPPPTPTPPPAATLTTTAARGTTATATTPAMVESKGTVAASTATTQSLVAPAWEMTAPPRLALPGSQTATHRPWPGGKKEKKAPAGAKKKK